MSDRDKMKEDAFLFGLGIMKDGKHIPIQDVYINTEMAELRKDKERLDWLDSKDGAILHEGYGEYEIYFDGVRFPTARKAIDAAMQQTDKEVKG